MRIDQPRDHRAAAQVDHARRRAGQFAYLRRGTERGDAAVAHGQRLRRRAVEDHDLAVEQHRIGRLRTRRTGENYRREHYDRKKKTAARDARYCRCMVHSVSMNIAVLPGGERRVVLSCL